MTPTPRPLGIYPGRGDGLDSASSARVNDLAQQVTDFARQHEQHATALQAQLQQQAEQVERLTEQYAHISADYKSLAELLAQA